MTSRQITIGPEFFAKARNDYENFEWALVREFAQNSIDCGSTEIKFKICHNFDGNDVLVTILEVTNNGNPMTEDVVINKLLCLGGSGKDFQNSVGGFGKAKELLYLCHNWFNISSGSTFVTGSGASYELAACDYVHGTISTIEIKGDNAEQIIDAVKRFVSFLQWDGTIVLEVNGNVETFTCNNPKGTRRRDLDFGTIYTNKSMSNVCVVRIGGIPMFTKYCGLERMVILELNGKSSEVLTSNRDGLVYPYSGQLSNFITELSVDKKRALKQITTSYEKFNGAKFGHRVRQTKNEVSAIQSIVMGNCPESTAAFTNNQECLVQHTSARRSSESPVQSGPFGLSSSPTHEMPVARIGLGHEFIIKNESGMEIPDYYRPTSTEFSEYSRRLVRIWGRLMLEMHRLFDREDVFSIGFIFDSETSAEHEQSDSFGRVYYLSPAEIVEQSNSRSKSFKKRWKLDNEGKKMLLSIAAHEFVHGLGYSYHSDSFANRYTDVMGKVMANMTDFTWCYRA